MDLYWEIERLRALQEDTPHIWEQQSGFLRPVVQPNNYHWMPESSNTAFAHHNIPSYPPSSTFDFHQKPEQSVEDLLMDMFKTQAAQFDAQIQSNTESIQRLTDQLRPLIENQNNIPQESFSDDTGEAFEYQSEHDDILSEKEAEQYQQPEVSVQEPIPVTTPIDFYISDSDMDPSSGVLT